MSPRKSPRLDGTNRDAEVTHLRERVKLLAQENERLRSFIADNGLAGALSPKSEHEADGERRERRVAHRSVIAHGPKAKSPNTSARPGTPRAPGRGCSCKGNCSSRICGCVKKNIPCAEFCRCGDELCQNSEPDKENIGDPNHQPQLSKDAAESLTKLSKLALAENEESEPRHPALELVNKRLDRIGQCRSLFSPDVADHQFNFETGDIESGNISLRFGDVTQAAEAGEEAVAEKPSDKNKKKKTRKEKNENVDDREHDSETVSDVQSEKVSPGRGDVPEAEEAVVDEPSDRKKNKKKKTRKEKNANVDDREHDSETVSDVQSEKVSPGRGDVPEAEEAVVDEPSDRKKNKKKKTRKEKNANVEDREHDLETVGDAQSDKILLGPGDVPEAGEAAAEAVAEKVSDRRRKKKKKTKGEKNEDHEEHRMGQETHRSATAPDPEAATTDEEKVATDFDPMKPRRQLSRSPLVSKTVPRTERLMDVSEIPLPAPLKEESEDEPLEPEELKQDVVPDWDQHKANLVECTICKRKLYPHRIKKHEASCQNI